jgi:NTE family protein
MARGRVRLAAALAALALGCAHRHDFDPAHGRTCLVLSVGGPDGVAHLGAVTAVKEAGLPISCVVGSSMGALVGALYASAPGEDTGRRFEALIDAYASETRAEAGRRGLGLGLLFGAAAALLSDSKLAPVLAAGGGFAVGVATTERMDRDRLVRVMDRAFGGRALEALPVAFVPLHVRPEGGGVVLVTPRTGPLAEAVGASIANPLLFPRLDVARAKGLDPGADRAAATPIEDACRLFPGANLLVVNVSGRPALTSAAMTCPVMEVTIAPAGLAPDELGARGPAYRRAVDAGYQATRARLRRH